MLCLEVQMHMSERVVEMPMLARELRVCVWIVKQFPPCWCHLMVHCELHGGR